MHGVALRLYLFCHAGISALQLDGAAAEAAIIYLAKIKCGIVFGTCVAAAYSGTLTAGKSQ